jgi:hypothetical protein
MAWTQIRDSVRVFGRRQELHALYDDDAPPTNTKCRCRRRRRDMSSTLSSRSDNSITDPNRPLLFFTLVVFRKPVSVSPPYDVSSECPGTNSSFAAFAPF